MFQNTKIYENLTLIIEGIKDIENRTWATKVRGRVLVHASKNEHKEWFREPHEHLAKEIRNGIQNNLTVNQYYQTLGTIIGSIEIVDCVINHSSIWAEKSQMFLKSDIAYKPIYNWVLANPIKFPEPIPAKGKLSFWDYPNILAEPEEKKGELYCHCQLPVNEQNQVVSMIDHFRCRYCGGLWYK